MHFRRIMVSTPLVRAAELSHPLTFTLLKIEHHFDCAMPVLLTADDKSMSVSIEPEAMGYRPRRQIGARRDSAREISKCGAAPTIAK